MLPLCYGVLAEAINNPGSLIMKISTVCNEISNTRNKISTVRHKNKSQLLSQMAFHKNKCKINALMKNVSYDNLWTINSFLFNLQLKSGLSVERKCNLYSISTSVSLSLYLHIHSGAEGESPPPHSSSNFKNLARSTQNILGKFPQLCRSIDIHPTKRQLLSFFLVCLISIKIYKRTV